MCEQETALDDRDRFAPKRDGVGGEAGGDLKALSVEVLARKVVARSDGADLREHESMMGLARKARRRENALHVKRKGLLYAAAIGVCMLRSRNGACSLQWSKKLRSCQVSARPLRQEEVAHISNKVTTSSDVRILSTRRAGETLGSVTRWRKGSSESRCQLLRQGRRATADQRTDGTNLEGACGQIDSLATSVGLRLRVAVTPSRTQAIRDSTVGRDVSAPTAG